jgi:23S rRNA pseudouridine955/2504/2580 synthase
LFIRLKREDPVAVAARVVSVDEADIRLDRWFRRHFPGLTQGAIQKLCRTGQVRVDGRRVDAATRLVPGQSVRVPPLPGTPAPKPAPAIDANIARDLQHLVIYRDEHVLVLNKPHGMPVQGGAGITHHLDAVLDALRFGAPDRPRLVHRLDRDTSGVLLLARTPGTAAKLAAAFRTRAVEKTYWAVVIGRPMPLEGRIDLPLRRIGGQRGERTELADRYDPSAARAITDYRTLDHAGQLLAWLELSPLTGRTHQLRVHCLAVGTPILGDPIYAPPERNGAVAGLEAELHLHARALRLPHPGGGTLLVESDPPPHMTATFRTLGFHAPPARLPERC